MKWNCRMWTKNHQRKTEISFKLHFLTLLKNSYFKIVTLKMFTSQSHQLFRSTSCLYVTKITTLIWLQIWWTCVNREKANNSPSYCCAAINQIPNLKLCYDLNLKKIVKIYIFCQRYKFGCNKPSYSFSSSTFLQQSIHFKINRLLSKELLSKDKRST